MITLYGINNCDKIRKTRKWLQAHDLAYQLHDYRQQGLDRELAETLLQAFPWQTLINQRGTTWRQLAIEQRENLNATSARELIIDHPALIKRPLIHTGSQWLLGYNENELEETLIRNPV